MNQVLERLLGEAPIYECGTAGIDNAAVLEKTRVRPAFFDVSGLVYRLSYAKAAEYCRRCGSDDNRIAHAVAADVMSDVAAACRAFCCGPIMCFDSVRSVRKETYADYKGGRGESKKTPSQERVLGCKTEIVRLLRRVYCPGYRVQGYCCHGFESDDIIASFVLGLKQHGIMQESAYEKPVVIVSSDHDLHQVVRDNVHWADLIAGVLCTAEDLHKHTKIRCEDVVVAKCVGGCKSDNVKGVPGCGDVTVAEVLRQRNDAVSVTKARMMLQSVAGEAVLLRNEQLIRLPYRSSQMPVMRLTPTWPAPGVPDAMQALMEANGVSASDWPAFADVTLPRPVGAVPVCSWQRKVEAI